MSSALVRQALQFVESEKDSGDSGRSKNRTSSRRAAGQVESCPYRKKIKRNNRVPIKSTRDTQQDNLNLLLQLSQQINKNIPTSKIVERAFTGKPLLEVPPVEVPPLEEEESLLIPGECGDQ